MLAIEHLSLVWDDFHLTADWQLPPGSITALIGPSGAGKSTLLLALAGFLAPARGRILWQGRDVTGLAPAQRPMAILFQDQNLFPHLTVEQNLGLALAPNLALTAAQAARRAQVLGRLGLGGLGGRRPGQLSGGQQARAALGRVLLQDRPVLLLDEPFAALGPALKADLLDLVAALAAERGAMVLMVTHDPADARRIADHCVLVAEGRAAAPVPTQEFFANPPQALRDYLG